MTNQRNNTRVWVVALAVCVFVSLALGTALSYVAWQDSIQAHDSAQAAKTAVDTARTDLIDAEFDQTVANEDLTDYLIAVIYMNSYYASFLYDSDALYAASGAADQAVASLTSEVAGLEADLAAARRESRDADQNLNLTMWISGSVSGGILVAGVIASVVSLKNQRRRTGQSAMFPGADDFPDRPADAWFCSECGAANELGLFCTECGTTKISAAAAIVPPVEPSSSAPVSKLER